LFAVAFLDYDTLVVRVLTLLVGHLVRLTHP
jgi:hypothetical protein